MNNDKAEYHVLYQVSINKNKRTLQNINYSNKVSRKEYDECKIDNIEQRVPILKCDRPYDNVKYTLYISKFSPVPDAIEFTPGSSYYFISTSDGTFNGLYNTNGGTCKTHNMKITVNVLDSKNRITTKKTRTYNFRKSTNNLQITTSKTSVIDANTRNLDPLSMKILSSIVELPRTSKSQSKTIAISSTTLSTTTTKIPETVDDNIFILEPEIIDYNDILSQLISTSSAYSNSNGFNDKQVHVESFESGHLNKGQPSLFINFSFKYYMSFLIIYFTICNFFNQILIF